MDAPLECIPSAYADREIVGIQDRMMDANRAVRNVLSHEFAEGLLGALSATPFMPDFRRDPSPSLRETGTALEAKPLPRGRRSITGAFGRPTTSSLRRP